VARARGLVLASVLAACSRGPSDAELHRRAVNGLVYADARAACDAIRDAGDRLACDAAVVERFDQFDQCDSLGDEVWKSECLFQKAERIGRSGDYAGAIAACRASGYRNFCDGHIAQLVAVKHGDDTTAAAAAALAALGIEGGGSGNPEDEFWRAWFRYRIGKDLPLEPAECPTLTCRDAARHEIQSATALTLQAQGCDAPFAPAWGTSAAALRWMSEVRRRECHA
jgi:hypothetical protein